MTETTATPSAPAAVPQPSPRQFAGALLLAAVIGIPVSLAALGFVALVNAATTLVWETVPSALGLQGNAYWYLILVPVVGGLLVAAARLLPGHADHGPLDGFAKDTQPGALPGILLAALATLACGAVLGPEAPLIALGTGLGLLFSLRRSVVMQKLSSAAGGFAAFSALLGNPLLTALFLLESTAATVSSLALLPGLVASGVGFLVFTGVGNWAGISLPTFEVPGLPAYDSVTIPDLLWAVPIAVLSAVFLMVAVVIGKTLAGRIGSVPRFVAIPVAGLALGVLFSIYVAVSGQSDQLVLFSGEHQLPMLLGETSAGAVLLILVIKGLGYAISLGSGFRGGPIFPALYLGIGVGMLVALAVDGIPTTAAVAVGMSAAAAATMRLPFAASALSLLMVGSAGAATTVMTILGAVIGFLTARVLMQVVERRQEAEPAAAA